MRFHYISDLHLEKRVDFPRHLSFCKNIPLFLAGDIGNVYKSNYKDFLHIASAGSKHVFLVAGNHEYHTQNTFEEVNYQIEALCSQIGNITFLNKKAVQYEGYTVVGATLWTHSPSYGISPRRALENKRHRLDVSFIERAMQKQDKVIVVTHHLPSYKLIVPGYANNPSFRDILFRWASHSDHLIKPPLQSWICGHTHLALKTSINNVKFFINAGTNKLQVSQ
jgi:predicted phosphodiesterase